MVCINARHFIGFNRLWISFLSTPGLLGFHYSWRNMFNSELGTANTSVPWAFIHGYKSYSQAWACCFYMDQSMAEPLLRKPVLVWNKGGVFPPSLDDFLSFAQWWAALTLGLNGSFALGRPSQQRSLRGHSKGHALLHPIFIQGQSSCQPSIMFSPAFT